MSHGPASATATVFDTLTLAAVDNLVERIAATPACDEPTSGVNSVASDAFADAPSAEDSSIASVDQTILREKPGTQHLHTNLHPVAQR